MSGVRKALEAAGEAVRKALVKPPCCMEGTGCELPPCHCSRVAASAAIAAFLGALPSDYEMSWWDSVEGVRKTASCEALHLLAVAVEAAAREGAPSDAGTGDSAPARE